MKFKNLSSLTAIAVALLTFTSCDEATTVDFDTKLTTTIEAEATEASELKSEANFPFAASAILNIEDDSKVKDYLDRIKEMDIKSVTATFTGIPEGHEILSLNIYVDNYKLPVTLENIINGQAITLDLSDAVLLNVSNTILDKKSVTLKIDGFASAEMKFSTLMQFDVTVKANVLD
jgi:hypothetical protein